MLHDDLVSRNFLFGWKVLFSPTEVPVEPSEMLFAGLSAMLAHITSATSKSTVPAIMSFLVGMRLSFERLTRGRVAHKDGFLNK